MLSVVFVLLLVVDTCGRALAPTDSKTRWFAVHALANAIVSITAVPDLLGVATDAKQADYEPDNLIPVLMALSLHIYHVVFYHISAEDRLHHILFALVMGLPSYIYARRITNVMLFFLSGFPGGLIYTLLTARRLGQGRWIHEPKASFCINAFIRAPGMLWAAGCALQYSNVPVMLLGVQITLSVCNALFYTWQSYERVVRCS